MKKCEACGYDLSVDSAHVCTNWQLAEGPGIPPKTTAPDAPETVNHPAHYNAGAVECIDAIEAALTPEEYRGFLKGNVLKYTWREKYKGGMEAMRKARWYLDRLLGART